jgi:hypothetical protein
MNYKKSIVGSIIAFIIATSCCWLPALIIAVGGGSALMGFSSNLEKYSSIFMGLGVGLLLFGVYTFIKKRNKGMKKNTILQSVITCPNCGHKKEETMPTDACQYFYECEKCKERLKPIGEDCCVYCSYGTVPCPPIQENKNCC